MRKLFWVCLAGGVMVVAGVFTTAQIALRHPRSFCGQVLFSASSAVATLNPLHGVGPLVARLEEMRQAEAGGEVAGAAEESAVAADEKPANPAEDAPIVIVEDDNVLRTSPGAAQPSLQPPPVPVEEGLLVGFEVECPASTVAKTSPPVMPYASEEACEPESCPKACPHSCAACACERLHMPAVEECEVLPMPSAEEEQEEGEVSSGCPTGGAEKLLRVFGQMMKKSGEQPACPTPAPTPDCREDHNYHHHYPACPYTGRSYCPCPESGHHCPTPPAAEPEKPAGGEEASEDGGKSALKKIRSYKAREIDGDRCPVCPGVDTLEMRPEDRQLYEYGPGVL